MPYRSGKNSTRLFVLLFLGVLLSALAFSWLLLSSSLFIPHPSATQVLSGDPKPIVIPQLTPPKSSVPSSSEPAQETVQTAAQTVIKEVAKAITPTEAEQVVPAVNQPVEQTVNQLAAASTTTTATQTDNTTPEGILGKKATAEPEITPEPASAVNNTPIASSQSDTSQASPETSIAVTPELTAPPETAETEQALANTVEPPVPEQTASLSESAAEPTADTVPDDTVSASGHESVPAPEPTPESTTEPGLVAEAPPAALPTEVALAETETLVTAEPAPATAEPEALASDTTVPTNTGWIYAGQFSNGQWITSGLQLDKNTEPLAGESYQLTWGANVRAAPPGQRSSRDDPVKLAETIATIPVGNEIKVVQVKYSGKNGHIWLEVAY